MMANIKCSLGSFVIFSGVPDQYCKKTLHFCDFSGGGGVRTPCPLWIHPWRCTPCIRTRSRRLATILYTFALNCVLAKGLQFKYWHCWKLRTMLWNWYRTSSFRLQGIVAQPSSGLAVSIAYFITTFLLLSFLSVHTVQPTALTTDYRFDDICW